jgi:hypothetical protein
MAGTVAIITRRHPVTAPKPVIREQIGLRAVAAGQSLRVQWDAGSRPVRGADRAVLFIEDGGSQSKLDLTGQQLDSSSVLYWPRSQWVAFRMEVYRGTEQSTSTAIGLPEGKRSSRRETGRAFVERVRPSPFERAELEIEVTQARSAPVAVVLPPVVTPVDYVAPERESWTGRFFGKIPLLGRLHRHPSADNRESR